AIAPRFEIAERIDSETIQQALDSALDGDGERMASAGNLSAVFKGARVVTAQYRVGLALHAAIEPMTETATREDGRLRLCRPTQAPGLARAAVARLLGLAEDDVVVHPMLTGGSFGQNLEVEAAQQAAIIARDVKRPVQLTWSRGETCSHDR